MTRQRLVVVPFLFFFFFFVHIINADHDHDPVYMRDVWPMSGHDVYRTNKNGYGLTPIGATPTGFVGLDIPGTTDIVAPPLISRSGNLWLIQLDDSTVPSVAVYPPPSIESSDNWNAQWLTSINTCTSNCNIGSAPVIDDRDRMYVTLQDSLHAINHSSVVWNRTWYSQTDSAPLVTHVKKLALDVFINSDFNGTLHAISTDNGITIWSQPGKQLSTPTLGFDGTVIACSGVTGTVYAFDLANGTELWHHELGAISLLTVAVDIGQRADDRLADPREPGNIFVALNTSSIAVVDRFNGDIRYISLNNSFTISATLPMALDASRRQLIVVCATDQLCAVNMDSGLLLWSRKLENKCQTISTPPSLDSLGNIYIACYEGMWSVLRPNGEILQSTSPDLHILMPIAISNGRVYVLADTTLKVYYPTFNSDETWAQREALIVGLTVGVPSLAVILLILCSLIGIWCVKQRVFDKIQVYDVISAEVGGHSIQAGVYDRQSDVIGHRNDPYDFTQGDSISRADTLTSASLSEPFGGPASYGYGSDYISPSPVELVLPQDIIADRLVKRARRERWYIPYAELRLHNTIGQGGKGTIYKATWKGSNVAVKTITGGFVKLNDVKSNELERSKHIDEFIKEIGFLSSLRHPNIVMFLGATVIRAGSLGCGIVMEYCPLGSLWDVVHNSTTRFTWEIIIKLARGIAAGMVHLHSLKILHRDLKSPNILVTKDYTARITDFGLSKFMPENADETMTFQIGSPFWMPPEMMSGVPYSETADVYSFAIILYELLAREQPFIDVPVYQIYRVVTSGNRPSIPDWCPVAYSELMQQCWHRDATQRPSFDTIVARLQGVVARQQPASDELLPLPSPRKQ